MKRITSLLALGFFSLGLATSASAQTKVTQLVIQNASGTTKLSQTSEGMTVDNYLILQRSGNANSTVKLTAPSSNGTREFLFPESSGTLLTNATNTFTSTQTFPTTAAQGDALIASINGGSTKIDAARLNLSSLTLGGVQSVAGSNLSLNVGGTATDVTLSLNPGFANTWTAVQTFPSSNDATGIAQGNALIASINAGNTALNGYVTNGALATSLAAYSTTAQMNSAIATALSPYSTTTQMNSAISTALGSYTNTTGMNTAISTALNSYTNTAGMNAAITTAISNPANLPSNILLESEVLTDSTIAKTGTSTLTLGMVDLSTSGVAAGAYTNANITVDRYGRIRKVANGASGGSGGGSVSTTLSSGNAEISLGSNAVVFLTSTQTNSNSPQSRTFTLPSGASAGHVINIHNAAGYCELAGTNLLLKSGTVVDFGPKSTMILAWNSTDGKWVEIMRSL